MHLQIYHSPAAASLFNLKWASICHLFFIIIILLFFFFREHDAFSSSFPFLQSPVKKQADRTIKNI